jgi:hypothetical protein
MAHSINDDCPRQPLWSRIFATLREKGYVTDGDRLRMLELQACFRKVLSAGFEDARLEYIANEWKLVEGCIRAATRQDRAAPASVLVLLDWVACEIEPLGGIRERRHSSLKPAPIQIVARESRREQWLALNASAVPGTSRTEIRRSAWNLWAWLYRNDAEWLRANQKPAVLTSPRRRAHELPQFFMAAVRGNCADLRERASGREPLPSAYQLRLAYGMGEHLFNRAISELGGGVRTREVPGVKEIFVRRRVHRAVRELTNRGKPLDIATVSREARLRIETVRRFSNLS